MKWVYLKSVSEAIRLDVDQRFYVEVHSHDFFSVGHNLVQAFGN